MCLFSGTYYLHNKPCCCCCCTFHSPLQIYMKKKIQDLKIPLILLSQPQISLKQASEYKLSIHDRASVIHLYEYLDYQHAITLNFCSLDFVYIYYIGDYTDINNIIQPESVLASYIHRIFFFSNFVLQARCTSQSQLLDHTAM